MGSLQIEGTMKIVEAWPPNIEQIRSALDISNVKPVFTYGDTMYNPYGHKVDRALEAHEETHIKQQEKAGGPDKWWERYLAEPEFRAAQEIAAYRQHLRSLRKLTKDRKYVAWVVNEWAGSLSGAMYGGCVTHAEALRRIRTGIGGW